MKVYRYSQPGPHGEHMIVEITDDQILNKYYDFWCKKMIGVGKRDMISKRACIEDFCDNHWACEYDPVQEIIMGFLKLTEHQKKYCFDEIQTIMEG